MKKIKYAVLAITLCTAHLFASTMCSFNGGSLTSTCYGQGLVFNTNDTLNYYTQFGSATQNPFDMQTEPANSLVGYTASGVKVSVSLGPGGATMPGGTVADSTTASYIAREDNTRYVYETDGVGDYAWTFPGDGGAVNNPYFHSFAGQFSAPTAEVVGTEASGAWGAYLLGPTDNSGDGVVGTMVFNFNQGMGDVGFQIDSVAVGSNTNFVAEMDAYNVSGTLLGTYVIHSNGTGGQCATLVNNSQPVPCNDAQLVGYVDPNNSISKVVVYAKDSSGDNGFFLSNLVAEDTAVSQQTGGVPEPATYVLFGPGLLTLGIFLKRRRATTR